MIFSHIIYEWLLSISMSINPVISLKTNTWLIHFDPACFILYGNDERVWNFVMYLTVTYLTGLNTFWWFPHTNKRCIHALCVFLSSIGCTDLNWWLFLLYMVSVLCIVCMLPLRTLQHKKRTIAFFTNKVSLWQNGQLICSNVYF